MVVGEHGFAEVAEAFGGGGEGERGVGGLDCGYVGGNIGDTGEELSF